MEILFYTYQKKKYLMNDNGLDGKYILVYNINDPLWVL